MKGTATAFCKNEVNVMFILNRIFKLSLVVVEEVSCWWMFCIMCLKEGKRKANLSFEAGADEVNVTAELL